MTAKLRAPKNGQHPYRWGPRPGMYAGGTDFTFRSIEEFIAPDQRVGNLLAS